ncbi:helicase-related protein [Dysgonomonas sp.]
MSTNFFTNTDSNTLINKMEGVLANNGMINCFDAVVGYLRASGYFQIRHFLGKIDTIRILVGINTDKFIAEAQQKGLIYMHNCDQIKDELLQNIKEDIESSHYSKEVEDGMLQFIDDIVNKKIEVRAHPSRRIHAKIYILYPQNFNEHTLGATVITGSSNLSDRGLGIGNDRQYEFNVLLNRNQDVDFAKSEFEKLWKEAEGCDILPIDAKKVKGGTYLAGDITPYELYMKLLIEYFDDRISYDFNNVFEMPKGFKKMEYQIEAVDEGFKKMLKYDGFFLSDVVGLGKTVIATMITKRFILENGINNTKVLVVYPPAVEKNWKTTFDRFGITNVKFISNGSLKKVLDPENYDYWQPEEYDLILVDESHKFRNHKTGIFQQLQEICKYPRINTGKIEGRKKKVMLISATPLNNSPEDLYHQILLFQNPRQSTLDGISNLTAFFSPKTQEFQRLKNETPLNVNAVKKLYEEIREKVIKPITVRRTRTDIEAIDRFKKDVDDFPKVQKPDKVEYLLNKKQTELFNSTVEQLVNKLQYNRYKAISGLKDEVQNLYYEKAELVSKSLAFIMKTLLVKRLESSFFAFKHSLEKFHDANQRMIEMFENDKVFIAPDLDINKFYEKGLSEEEIEEEILKIQEENPKNRAFRAEDFKPQFIEVLRSDQTILSELLNAWQEQKDDDDPKLKKFMDLLQNEFFDKKRNVGQKLVVFSESTDTVDYLSKYLNRDDVLTISAKNRNKQYKIIEQNFDANSETHKNDYDIIITTDVLAEGVNLHRSNIIINYDTPWNSTRLMQRIGRVNRIGSRASSIYNYVFYPSAQGNNEINLIKNSLAKIQAFHTAFGEDNQIYSTEEIISFDLDRLFDDSIEKEELNKELLILEDLKKFKELNSKEFRRIKELSLRCRTGRNAKTINDTFLHNASLIFLKTRERNNFYLVNEKEARELSSLEALEYFYADKNEPAVLRIEQHNDQVLRAKRRFESDIQQAFSQPSEAKASGQQVRVATNFIKSFKPTIENPEKVVLLEHLIKMIEWGTITNIAIEINTMIKQIERKQITRDECMERIIRMAQKYDSYYMDEAIDSQLEIPVIILSESFN